MKDSLRSSFFVLGSSFGFFVLRSSFFFFRSSFFVIDRDLRRAAARLIVGADVPRLAVSKSVNHVETGVSALHDRHRC